MAAQLADIQIFFIIVFILDFAADKAPEYFR